MPAKIPLPFGPDALTLDKGTDHPYGTPNPEGVRVSQEYGNSYSHGENVDDGIFYYSVDFLLPKDQLVLAQGTGKVVQVVEKTPDGGPANGAMEGNSRDSSLGDSNMGNFVTVKYEDGVYATYQHLKQDSVPVESGSPISAGTVIGLVGNTGIRSATHLHVTYGKDTFPGNEHPLGWGNLILTDGSKEANPGAEPPIAFASDPDGVLDRGTYYKGDNLGKKDTSSASGRLTGGPNDDILIGDAGYNELRGNAGNPTSSPPDITSYDTFQEGDLIFLSLNYTDPDGDAEGFGFRGVKGSGWAEETHPFSSPSYGRVSPNETGATSPGGTVEYPFNHLATTDSAYESDVEAWIYDKEGLRSDPVTVHLKAENQDQREVVEPIPTEEVPFFILGGSNSELDPIGGTAM